MPPIRVGLLLLLLSTILGSSIAAPLSTRIGIPGRFEDRPASAILDRTKPPIHDPLDWPVSVVPPRRHLGLDDHADSDTSESLKRAILTRTNKPYTTDTPYLPGVLLPPKRPPFPLPPKRDLGPTFADEDQGEQPSSPDHNSIKPRWFEAPRTQAWPDATLRLRFADMKASEAFHERVYEALQLWKLRAPFMTFHKLPTSPELSNDTTTIVLSTKHNGMCSSTVGFVPNDTITLDQNASVNAIAHELGHSIGLFHEHQRPDRGLYVDVFCWNIDPLCSTMPSGSSCCDKHSGSLPDECCNVVSQFDIDDSATYLHSKPYDPYSIMHYFVTAFSKWYRVSYFDWPDDIATIKATSGDFVVPLEPGPPTELDGEGVCHLYPKECNNNIFISQDRKRAIPDRTAEDIGSDIDHLYPIGRRPDTGSCEHHQCPVTCSTLQPCRSGRMCIHNPGDPSGPLVEKNTTCLAKMSECVDLGCGGDGPRLLRRVPLEDEYIL